jgi:hypothetical protein
MCRATLISLVVLTSGCASVTDTGCAGWRAIWMDPGTPEWLVDHDRRALEGIVAHNETGAERCGW